MIQGITIERSNRGKSRFVKIDLDKYGDNKTLNRFFKENEFEVEEPVKWSKKMLEAFKEVENGEWERGNIDNFWNV